MYQLIFIATLLNQTKDTLCQKYITFSRRLLTSQEKIILGGDFNLFFHSLIETEGGNPFLKTKTITETLETMTYVIQGEFEISRLNVLLFFRINTEAFGLIFRFKPFARACET